MLAKLKLAVQSRNELLVQKILQNKPRLNCQEGGEILWQAVLMVYELEIASLLVEAGADLSVYKPGCIMKRTFLHVLVSSLEPRDHRLAVLMLDYGADINARDAHTNGLLHYAIRAHHSAIELIEELLIRGCRVSHDVIAMTVEHPLATKLLPLLIDAGNAADDTRKERLLTALYHSSCYHGNESEIIPVVKVLLDVILPVEINGSVHVLFNAIQTNKIQMVKLFIARGSDVSAKYKNELTALDAAFRALEPSIDMIKLLVLHGADFSAVGSDGATPLSRLRQFGYENDKTRFAIKQLAILNAKRVTVNQMDFNWIQTIPRITQFYGQCQEELELMKMTTVFNDVTLFDVLSDGPKFLSFMIRNCKFVQSYKDSLENSDDYPIFYDELDYMYKAAEERRDVLLEREETLCEVLDNIVPYLPLQEIVYHFYMTED